MTVCTPFVVCAQVMERLCVRVQQQVCMLKGCEDGEDIQTARQILKEARDSRAVSRPKLAIKLLCILSDCHNLFSNVNQCQKIIL